MTYIPFNEVLSRKFFFSGGGRLPGFFIGSALVRFVCMCLIETRKASIPSTNIKRRSFIEREKALPCSFMPPTAVTRRSSACSIPRCLRNTPLSSSSHSEETDRNAMTSAGLETLSTGFHSCSNFATPLFRSERRYSSIEVHKHKRKEMDSKSFERRKVARKLSMEDSARSMLDKLVLNFERNEEGSEEGGERQRSLPVSETDEASRDSGYSSTVSSFSRSVSGESDVSSRESQETKTKRCQWLECVSPCLQPDQDMWEHIEKNHILPLKRGLSGGGRNANANRKLEGKFACRWIDCKAFDRAPGRGEAEQRFAWLENHVRERHGGSRPYVCIIEGCRQRFSSNLALNAHLAAGHSSNNNNNEQDETETLETKPTPTLPSSSSAATTALKRNQKRCRFFAAKRKHRNSQRPSKYIPEHL